MHKSCLDYLRGTYEEDFVVEGIYEVKKSKDYYYSVKFAPVRNDDLKCQLFLHENGAITSDDYLNNNMSDRLDEVLETVVKSIFRKELVVFSFLTPNESWVSNQLDKNMTLEQYLDRKIAQLENFMELHVQSVSVNEEEEADRIEALANTLWDKGFRTFIIRVHYVRPPWVERLRKERHKKYYWMTEQELNEGLTDNLCGATELVVFDPEDMESSSIKENVSVSFKYFEEMWEIEGEKK